MGEQLIFIVVFCRRGDRWDGLYSWGAIVHGLYALVIVGRIGRGCFTPKDSGRRYFRHHGNRL